MLRLRRVIDSRGMTVKGLASAIGVAEKTFYNKLTGATDFTYSEARAIKSIFPEYDIDYLLTEEATAVNADGASA